MKPNELDNPKCPVASDSCCSHQQGKEIINGIIHRLRRQADNLQTLLDMLPSQPTREQNEALFAIALEMHCN